MKLLCITILISISLRALAPILPESYILPRQEQIIKEYIKKELDTKRRIIDSMLCFLQLGFDESRLNPLIVNDFGYVGMYQLGKTARKAVGAPVITSKHFRRDTKTGKTYLKHADIWPVEDQKKAVSDLMLKNRVSLKTTISKNAGTYIIKNGHKIKVTEAGILMAAHLAGPNNVIKYFKTGRKYNPKDYYKTSLEDYLIKYSSFDF